MFEIDPKLFVTCRLCLDNTGVYQIVPSVQQQIKFCYEIEVDPFDGLPQLICKNCELLLSKYAKAKTKYIEKQQKLRERLAHKNVKLLSTDITATQTEQDTVSSTQQLPSEQKGKKGKKYDLSYSVSSDSSDVALRKKAVKRKNAYKRIKKIPSLQFCDSTYKRWFICRFCSISFESRTDIKKHITTHSFMLHKYLKYIKSDCSVKLYKVDRKPNICKSDQIVVHSLDKFICSENNYYYSIIRPKHISDSSSDDNNSSAKVNDVSSESSDNVPITRSKKKRRRIESRSSNDTVVVQNNIKNTANTTRELPLTSESTTPVADDSECISVNDSDTESYKSNNNTKNENGADVILSIKSSDYKTIQNIISVCFKRHLKRLESIESEIPCNIIEQPAVILDPSVKHKVLSIGRKMITKPGFSCIGILRYLEHQNLEILWTPRCTKHKKYNFVRIMMKLKNRNDNNADEFGWKILENADREDDDSIDCRDSPIETQEAMEDQFQTSEGYNNMSETDRTHLEKTVAEVTMEQAVLYASLDCSVKDVLLKKLLNANPVANPKTLPKKTQTPIVAPFEQKNRSISKDEAIIVDAENAETSHYMSMPVITSTMSLAEGNNMFSSTSSTQRTEQCSLVEIVSENNKETVNNRPQQELGVANSPRIKVKPVSELMSDKALDIIDQQHMVQNNTLTQNTNVANTLGLSSSSDMQNEIPNITQETFLETTTEASTSVSQDNNNTKTEYVIMNSIDLPHTKTVSPFEYFKSLLIINEIYLLGPNEIMSNDFYCLLKFKLVFHQETTVPVVLCLGLYNHNNRFCIKVKDVHQKDIDVSKLSPNWQWEILKVYRGSIDAKMLENAQKISSVVYENTRKFLCYLRSIEFRKCP